VLLLLFASCVDTERVIVEAPVFDDPPVGAAGFLGYANQQSSQPVCGNCHVGKYGEWRGTQHAQAWTDLQGSGHSQAACEGCHSVNALGNASTASGGYTATSDARYHDVQCESCHGPGLQHTTNPDASQPLASIEVGTDLTNGCGECHTGVHNPFVEEWAASRHGNRGTHQQEEAACVSCHEARGVFAAWGIKADYIEKEETEPIPITCAVCHDPHDATNPGQLRFPIDVADVEQNLCMKCHHKRAVPEVENSRGAHSPQGPLLLGTDVGWIPPDFSYENGQIVATHGTERNPRLCAGCHVNRYEVTDPATGDFVFNSTGHLFKPIPCLDAQGLPSADTTCTIQQRSFKACTASGCHGTESTARSVLLVARARIADLVSALNALLAQVPASELNTTDGRISTAEGAKFNAGLAAQAGSAIHNPFLIEALLTASIKQVEEDYGLLAPAIVLENVLAR
jgi:predicted CXXCH cytochrome family protein